MAKQGSEFRYHVRPAGGDQFNVVDTKKCEVIFTGTSSECSREVQSILEASRA